MKIIILIINIILLSSIQAAAQKADFLIVENPSGLIIYNKYQQNISADVLDKFNLYTPFMIINSDELLSDQISRASRVEYNNRIMFILKGEDDQYLQTDEAGYIRQFNNCTLIGDTIKIIRENRISIFPRPEWFNQSKQKQYLEKDQYYIRIFRYGNLYYLKLIEDNPVYGWSQLSDKRSWEISETIPDRPASIPEKLIFQLRVRMESANEDYENYFTYFNNKYDKSLAIPKWELHIEDDKIEMKLNNPDMAENLKNSNRYLMQDIDNIFLGSEITPVFSDSIFSISISNNR